MIPIYSSTKAGVVHFSRCIAQVCDSESFHCMVYGKSLFIVLSPIARADFQDGRRFEFQNYIKKLQIQSLHLELHAVITITIS
jgi:NAD(P)-dependent dehydrogenase (short-subunit alcohol dehydrogenase family)